MPGSSRSCSADADAGDLVAVGRADAASGGADAGLAEVALGDFVQRPVVRHDQMRVGADLELGDVDAALAQAVHLLDQNARVDHDPVADDRHAVGAQDPAGEQVQGVGLIADDHRVSGVVAALVAHDVLDSATEQIGGLSLALIAPLGSDEYDCWHVARA